MNWQWQKFSELSGAELYEILSARQEVFVIEQNCVYPDCDGLDQSAWHLSGRDAQGLAAYLRVLPAGKKYPELSLGRVLVLPRVRGQKLGEALMREALARIAGELGAGPIRISAQSYLIRFYESLGFVKVGEEYLEDGIPHHEMLRD